MPEENNNNQLEELFHDYLIEKLHKATNKLDKT